MWPPATFRVQGGRKNGEEGMEREREMEIRGATEKT
jgi:hypothetical protein